MTELALFEGWSVIELADHSRLAGIVRTQDIDGTSFLRVEVLHASGKFVGTRLYSPASVYCITPVSEEVARARAMEAAVAEDGA